MYCKKHNWIVYEKDTDWDICSECSATRNIKEDKTKQAVLSFDKLKDGGFEIGDCGSLAQKLEDRIDCDLALDRLPKQQRRVLVLESEGYKPFEIAEIMGIKIRTVWDFKLRARKNLKNWLN